MQFQPKPATPRASAKEPGAKGQRGESNWDGAKKRWAFDLGVAPARCLRDRRYVSNQDAPEREGNILALRAGELSVLR